MDLVRDVCGTRLSGIDFAAKLLQDHHGALDTTIAFTKEQTP